MPGWHSMIMRWLSGVLTNAFIVGSLPTRVGLLYAVCMLLCAVPSFAVLPGELMYVFIYGGVK